MLRVGEVGLSALPHGLTLQGLLLLVIVHYKGLLVVCELLREAVQGPLQDTLHEGVVIWLRRSFTIFIYLGCMSEGI